MEETQKKLLALRILSLQDFDLADTDFDEILTMKCFPQVRSVTIVWEWAVQPTIMKEESEHSIISRNLSFLSIKKMSSLVILKFEIPSNNWVGGARLLTSPCLEEPKFIDAPFPQDVAFVGENGELTYLEPTSEKIDVYLFPCRAYLVSNCNMIVSRIEKT